MQLADHAQCDYPLVNAVICYGRAFNNTHEHSPRLGVSLTSEGYFLAGGLYWVCNPSCNPAEFRN